MARGLGQPGPGRACRPASGTSWRASTWSGSTSRAPRGRSTSARSRCGSPGTVAWPGSGSGARLSRTPPATARGRRRAGGVARWLRGSKNTSDHPCPRQHGLAVADLGLDRPATARRRARSRTTRRTAPGGTGSAAGSRRRSGRPRTTVGRLVGHVPPEPGHHQDPGLLEELEVLHVVDVAVDVDVGEADVHRVVADLLASSRGGDGPAPALLRLEELAEGLLLVRRQAAWPLGREDVRREHGRRPQVDPAARPSVVLEDLVGHRERRGPDLGHPALDLHRPEPERSAVPCSAPRAGPRRRPRPARRSARPGRGCAACRPGPPGGSRRTRRC